ncbi:sugar phosphate isomerase/epimerase family protein [Anoxybacteroides tepidamans]|uniref:sugar phosphate isomerase/epimerase family protein n=1 Tax=Anoxybacteroides tepidamans TaxID=265948 RepID=UPI000481EFD3|nr:TIM barrel protein [Anoxybacillus tepidamans]
MRKVIVPLNAFKEEELKEKGYRYYISAVSQLGADGVEIRRELLTDEVFPLVKLKSLITEFALLAIYSAPIDLWKQDGALNCKQLRTVFEEAKQIGATIVKVSLGFYDPNISDIRFLQQWLDEHTGSIRLLVENDQTSYGGAIRHLYSFFQKVMLHQLPVGMTFDIGNWKYCGEDMTEALQKFSPFIGYVHLKHVEKRNKLWTTLPLPIEGRAEWRNILNVLPSHLPVALEFPMENVQMVERYVQMIKCQQREGASGWMS